MRIDAKTLARFLVKAKCQAYAGDGKEIHPQRPGFRELEFSEGDWVYRDSYAGFFMAPGQEVVRFKDRPVWVMAYSGGLMPEYREDVDFAKQTFAFLKKALLKVEEIRPFRGPQYLKEGEWEYRDSSEGDVKEFKGSEQILYKEKVVFKQSYIGGLVIDKD